MVSFGDVGLVRRGGRSDTAEWGFVCSIGLMCRFVAMFGLIAVVQWEGECSSRSRACTVADVEKFCIWHDMFTSLSRAAYWFQAFGTP